MTGVNQFIVYIAVTMYTFKRISPSTFLRIPFQGIRCDIDASTLATITRHAVDKMRRKQKYLESISLR